MDRNNYVFVTEILDAFIYKASEKASNNIDLDHVDCYMILPRMSEHYPSFSYSDILGFETYTGCHCEISVETRDPNGSSKIIETITHAVSDGGKVLFDKPLVIEPLQRLRIISNNSPIMIYFRVYV
jgi:hypothetical protein